MTVLILLGVLFALVLVHELGHFAVAKWAGMRVDEFGMVLNNCMTLLKEFKHIGIKKEFRSEKIRKPLLERL